MSQFVSSSEATVYANSTTGAVEWIYDTKKDDVLEVLNGFKAQTFTDADFELPPESKALCDKPLIGPPIKLNEVFFF